MGDANAQLSLSVEPAWITSHEHLDRYLRVSDTTSWLRLLLGRGYDLPRDFPYVDVSDQRFPLGFYSSGALTIQGGTLSYAAHPLQPETLGGTRHNLDTSLNFSVALAENPTFSRFRLPRARLSYFSINWVVLALRRLNAPFLICAGTRGLGMGRIGRGTDALYASLASWVTGSSDSQGTPPNQRLERP